MNFGNLYWKLIKLSVDYFLSQFFKRYNAIPASILHNADQKSIKSFEFMNKQTMYILTLTHSKNLIGEYKHKIYNNYRRSDIITTMKTAAACRRKMVLSTGMVFPSNQNRYLPMEKYQNYLYYTFSILTDIITRYNIKIQYTTAPIRETTKAHTRDALKSE